MATAEEDAAAMVVTSTCAASMLLILCWQRQRQQHRDAQRAITTSCYRYRAPLPVPIGEEFNLDFLTETWCLEFFRLDLHSLALVNSSADSVQSKTKS